MSELFYNVMDGLVYFGLPVALLAAIVLDDLLADRFIYFGKNRS